MIWLLFFSVFNLRADGPVNVVTTIPDLAWMVQEIGGGKVKAQPLLRGTENPHYVDAVPSFIAKVAGADAVLSVGLELEVGWLPKVVARTGKAEVQPGGKGYAEVSRTVKVLDVPAGKIDRSMGDVHPGGNPHFWLGPLALAEGGTAVVELLAGLRPEAASEFAANQARFTEEMKQLVASNRAKFGVLTGKWLMEYHEEFTYYLRDHGIESWGSLEAKPGVAPSAGRLAQVAMAARKSGVQVLLAADYAPKQTLARFSELSGIPVVSVPTSGRTNSMGYVALQNHIANALVEAAAPKAGE